MAKRGRVGCFASPGSVTLPGSTAFCLSVLIGREPAASRATELHRTKGSYGFKLILHWHYLRLARRRVAVPVRSVPVPNGSAGCAVEHRHSRLNQTVPSPKGRSVGKEPLGGRAGHTGTDRGRDKRLGFSHHPPNATSIRVRLHLLGLPRGTHHGITIPQANRVIVIEQMKHLLD